MTEAPKVYCPKDKEMVPIWYCLGSAIQQRRPCSDIISATVDWKNDSAEVNCNGWINDEQKTNDKPVPR